MQDFFISQGIRNANITDEVLSHFLNRCNALSTVLNRTYSLKLDEWDEKKIAKLNGIVSGKNKYLTKEYVAKNLYPLIPSKYICDGEITFVDLYLTTPNLLNLDPVTDICKNFSMTDLLENFGKLGNWTISSFDGFDDLVKKIKSLAQLKYGLIEIESENNFTYKYYSLNEGKLAMYKISLDEEKLISSSEVPLMAKVRFYHQLESCGVDEEVFPNFFKFIIDEKENIKISYRAERSQQNINHSLQVFEKTEIPNIVIDEKTALCLSCEVEKTVNDFPLCGHTVCNKCQLSSKSPKCLVCGFLYLPNCENHTSWIENMDKAMRMPADKKIIENVSRIRNGLIENSGRVLFDPRQGINGGLEVEWTLAPNKKVVSTYKRITL